MEPDAAVAGKAEQRAFEQRLVVLARPIGQDARGFAGGPRLTDVGVNVVADRQAARQRRRQREARCAVSGAIGGERTILPVGVGLKPRGDVERDLLGVRAQLAAQRLPRGGGLDDVLRPLDELVHR